MGEEGEVSRKVGHRRKEKRERVEGRRMGEELPGPCIFHDELEMSHDSRNSNIDSQRSSNALFVR